MLEKALRFILYASLTSVVLSELRTVALAIFAKDHFLMILPHSGGRLYPVFVATSAAAGVNAVMIGLRRRTAVIINIAIGLWSMALLQLVSAPLVNSIIVAAACAVTTIIPLCTWRTFGTRLDPLLRG